MAASGLGWVKTFRRWCRPASTSASTPRQAQLLAITAGIDPKARRERHERSGGVESARTSTPTPSRPDCRQKWLHADDVHDPREIVDEHMQGHLGSDLGQALHQKVTCPHAHLERAEGMLDRLTAHAH